MREYTMSSESHLELEIQSNYKRAKATEDDIVNQAQSLGYGEEDLFALRLALEEALANAIKHGNAGDNSKKVNIRYYVDKDRADIYISDEGIGFNPIDVPDPTTADKICIPNGRGILLMRAYMNIVEYSERGNTVHMVKLRSNP